MPVTTSVIKVTGRRATPPDAVYIGRPGPWGNPYRIGPDGDRNAVIAKYEARLRQNLRAGVVSPERLAGLAGRRLACYCAPRPCHGHVLARYAEAAANHTLEEMLS